MTNTQAAIDFFTDLKKSLSASRFSGYHQRGTKADALAKYLWNAAMHHHSIWHWKDLQQSHQDVRVLIGYLSQQMDLMAEKMDRFPEIYSNGIGDCQKLVSQVLKSIQPTP